MWQSATREAVSRASLFFLCRNMKLELEFVIEILNRRGNWNAFPPMKRTTKNILNFPKLHNLKSAASWHNQPRSTSRVWICNAAFNHSNSEKKKKLFCFSLFLETTAEKCFLRHRIGQECRKGRPHFEMIRAATCKVFAKIKLLDNFLSTREIYVCYTHPTLEKCKQTPTTTIRKNCVQTKSIKFLFFGKRCRSHTVVCRSDTWKFMLCSVPKGVFRHLSKEKPKLPPKWTFNGHVDRDCMSEERWKLNFKAITGKCFFNWNVCHRKKKKRKTVFPVA